MPESFNDIGRDTIYALSTGAVVSAISVFRISGPRALGIGQALSGRHKFPPRQLVRSLIRDPDSHDLLDDVLLVFFPEHKSFTGEALLEIHAHGGSAVRRRLAQAIEKHGVRLALPGEFARRRFDAGLMSLGEAEGLASLIEAETEIQRRQAMRVLAGEIGERAKVWRSQYIDVLALLEASIDFAEEEIGRDTENFAAQTLSRLIASLSRELAMVVHDEKALSRPTVSLVGPPNAGKSSLMNSLVKRDVSIVTPISGTTRDIIRSEIQIDGIQIELLDTAGLRDTTDEIEKIGVDRARSATKTADIRVLVLSVDTWSNDDSLNQLISESELIVWNKSDLSSNPPFELLNQLKSDFVTVSIFSPDSGNSVLAKIQTLLGDTASIESPISGSPRHRKCLCEALTDLEQAKESLEFSKGENAIEEVRSAGRNISYLIGDIDHEDILDDVFARFCIGK